MLNDESGEMSFFRLHHSAFIISVEDSHSYTGGSHALQPCECGDGGLGGAFFGLLRHDYQRNNASGTIATGFVLNDGGDGDLMFAEDAGDFGQDAGAIFDGEAEIVAAGQLLVIERFDASFVLRPE